MIEFTMPSLGADMESGTFVEWLVKPGDAVRRGQVVCVIETQKGAVEVEIWDEGVVERLVARPGDELPVGAVMAVLRGAAEPAGRADKPSPPAAERTPRASRPAKPQGGPPTTPAMPAAGRPRISPAARRRAVELGIDPATLVPSQPGAPLQLADVERAAAHPVAASATRVAPSTSAEARKQAMREAIAAAMSRSNRDIPHYYLGTTLRLDAALDWLEAHNATRPLAERALLAALQLRAVALALRDVPALNGWYSEGAFLQAPDVRIAVATSLRGGGLVTPALRDIDQASLPELSAHLRDLLTRARGGQLRSSELSDATITVTNLGELGVESVFGVIYPPQVALVGFGRVVERPWVADGALVVARTVHTSLAADHRATDGAVGARFLTRLAEYLEQPEKLWKPES